MIKREFPLKLFIEIRSEFKIMLFLRKMYLHVNIKARIFSESFGCLKKFKITKYYCFHGIPQTRPNRFFDHCILFRS